VHFASYCSPFYTFTALSVLCGLHTQREERVREWEEGEGECERVGEEEREERGRERGRGELIHRLCDLQY